ncbi:hypothetical protein D3C85_1208020 [compost metagenome]
MQLPAHVVRVDVTLAHDFFIGVGQQLVVVVRNDHFFLADQLPVEALRRTGATVVFIDEIDARRHGIGRVEVDARRTTHPALPRQVLPQGAALHVIRHVMHHQRFTRPEGRRIRQLDGHHEVRPGGLHRTVLVVVGILRIVLGGGGQHALTIGGGGPDLVLAFGGIAPP